MRAMRRFTIGATTLVLGWLALTGAALATTLTVPAWFQKGENHAIESSAIEPTIGWGTLMFQSAAQTATCKVVEAGNIVNHVPTNKELEEPHPSEAGGHTVLFQPYECVWVGGSCPITPRVAVSGLPWTQTPGGSAEEEEWASGYQGIGLAFECPAHTNAVRIPGTESLPGGPYYEVEQVAATSESFTGGESTIWRDGTSGLKPSENAMAGSSLSGLTIKGKIKTEGYEGLPSPITLGPVTVKLPEP
jgi:hypothetical protein